MMHLGNSDMENWVRYVGAHSCYGALSQRGLNRVELAA